MIFYVFYNKQLKAKKKKTKAVKMLIYTQETKTKQQITLECLLILNDVIDY